MLQFDSPIETLFVRALWWELTRTCRAATLSRQSRLLARLTQYPSEPGIEPPVPMDIEAQAQLLNGYRVDFLLRVADRRVVVECDGHEFHERTASQAERDRSRDRAFVAAQIACLRFTGRELNRDADRCAREALALFGSPAERAAARASREKVEAQKLINGVNRSIARARLVAARGKT